MKRIVISLFFIFLLCGFISCTRESENETVLFKDFIIPKEDHPAWTDLLTPTYRITRLETNDSCLIGPIDKIRKFKGNYYICTSSENIYRFNEEGKFISLLSCKGIGPEEYVRIEDFDICENEGRIEIWISENKSLKVYNAEDGSYQRKITFPFIIHKFKRLSNSDILVVAGLNDHSLILANKNGQIISDFLEKEIPYLMFRPVQFVKYNSNYLYQLGIANAYVSFDTIQRTFQQGVFSSEKKFLSSKQLLKLFQTYQMDFLREAQDYSYICNLVSLKDKVWLHTSMNKTNYLTKIGDGKNISTQFKYGEILSTFSVGDSEDSLLFYVLPEQQDECNQKLQLKEDKAIHLISDDNPCILEFF